MRSLELALGRLQVLAEVVQTGPHAAIELQYTVHGGDVISIPLVFSAVEPSQGNALAVLHAMWCAAGIITYATLPTFCGVSYSSSVPRVLHQLGVEDIAAAVGHIGILSDKQSASRGWVHLYTWGTA